MYRYSSIINNKLIKVNFAFASISVLTHNQFNNIEVVIKRYNLFISLFVLVATNIDLFASCY